MTTPLEERPDGRRRRIGLILIIVALLFAAVGGTYALTRSNQEDILLESANSLGPNPFTTAGVVQPTTTTTTTAVGTATTGLFGGSGNLLVCEPEGIISFLATHTDKAMAWVEARNSDPAFRWGLDWSKTKLTIADIPAYIHELIPGHLEVDTRVTNTGYKAVGHHTEHQSLLQKGMAVLFNRLGKPEVKCFCGNILFRPHHVSDPRYVGECWPGCHNPPVTPSTTTTTAPSTTTTCIDTAAGLDCGGGVSTTTQRTTTTRHVTVTTVPKATTTTQLPDTTIPRTTITTTQNPGGPK